MGPYRARPSIAVTAARMNDTPTIIALLLFVFLFFELPTLNYVHDQRRM